MAETHRFCNDCQTVKPLEGGFSPSMIKAGRPRCKLCVIKRYRNYHQKQVELGRISPLKTVNGLIHTKKIRYDGSSVKVSISTDEVMKRLKINNYCCELTGIEFNWPHKNIEDVKDGIAKWNSISIDRIIPGKDYTPDNIRIILCSLNMFMGTWGLDTALMVSHTLLNRTDGLRSDLLLDSALKVTLRQSLINMKSRSKKLPVTMTLDGLFQKLKATGGRCALTGLDMVWSNKYSDQVKTSAVKWNSMSFDKIDPNGPYSPENTRPILFCLNALKGRADEATMYHVARQLIERNPL